MYKIDSSIPIPASGTGRKRSYPLVSMAIGDSFLAPDENATASARQYARLSGKKFTSRKVEDGYRIWRIQ